jgi:hypothetical protein
VRSRHVNIDEDSGVWTQNRGNKSFFKGSSISRCPATISFWDAILLALAQEGFAKIGRAPAPVPIGIRQSLVKSSGLVKPDSRLSANQHVVRADPKPPKVAQRLPIVEKRVGGVNFFV